jgi:hypothetical protein
MAKENSSDRVNSASAQPHGWLRGFIDYLHHLIIEIASRLRHVQIHRSPMGDPKGDYDIWQKLGNHLEQMPVTGKHDVKRPAPPQGSQKGRNHPKNLASDTARSGSEPNEIREHNKTRAAHHHQPRVSQELQSKTMEHINIALILAAEGNQGGVKLHIDLANSAMQTASRFMSHDEYKVFEEKVESRVKAIVDSGRLGDSQG